MGRRGGAPARTGSTPPWWCIWTSSSALAALHLGPLLSEAERRYLICDATCEVWFERDGQVIGAGRATRLISRRLRRALEHRDRTCAVPGCGATRGLHAHHIRHWEDGGPTELVNLVLVCPYHHRLHHRGVITITGPARRSRRHRQRRPSTERQDRWPAHRTNPRPRWHPAPDPPASAPTGGGTNPSSRNHHQQQLDVLEDLYVAGAQENSLISCEIAAEPSMPSPLPDHLLAFRASQLDRHVEIGPVSLDPQQRTGYAVDGSA